MQWTSNGDPPLYVWSGDTWYNEKTKLLYECNMADRVWFQYDNPGAHVIPFPKKTRILVLR